MTDSKVLLHPNFANGYLFWGDDVDVEHYEILVQERVPLSDSTYQDIPVWRHHEWKNNYIHIPKEYRPDGITNKYSLKLKGYNSSHVELFDETVIPFAADDIHPWVDGCFRICNGPDYAWKLQMLLPTDGSYGYKYQLGRASFYNQNETAFEPFYEFMTWDYFNNIFSPSPGAFSDFYDIGNWSFFVWSFPGNNNDAENHIVSTFQNYDDIIYRDKFGVVITDPSFVGVRKAMGNWNHYAYNYSESLTGFFNGDPFGPSTLCINNTFWFATNTFNSYAEYQPVQPALECVHLSYPESDAASFAGNLGTECWDIISWVPYIDEEGGNSVTNKWVKFLECITNSANAQNDGSVSPWSTVKELAIYEIGESGKHSRVFQLNTSELFDENGFVPFNFTLNAGLHKVRVVSTLYGSYTPEFIFEEENKTTYSVAQADHFDFTVFPVPHSGDSYSVNFSASIDLRFSYSVYDFNGNRLHESRYQVAAGHDRDHSIISDLPLPSGLLLHVVRFPDGSSVSKTTLKPE